MKNNVLFLGCTQNYGYQFSAANTKVEFLARGLAGQGDICTIHNGINGTALVKGKDIKKRATVGTVITYGKRYNQLVSWLFNLPKLINDLRQCKEADCTNCIVLESPDYHVFLLYILLARLFKYKVLVISHEWGPTVSSIHPLRKPSTYLFSYTFGYLVDGILPISEFIINKIKHFGKPYLKIPIAADFNSVVRECHSAEDKYFLYCVYAAYKRVIVQIIDAFVQYSNDVNAGTKLILVLSGSKEQISIIEDYIRQKGFEADVIIKSKVPFDTLMSLYANALALIIPLDPDCQQDEARFSQKIAEYLSSGSPIISNNVGEIKYYFHNMENIILCDYSVRGFVNAFTWVANNQEAARQIGLNGFSLGKDKFNYLELSRELHGFINEI